MRIKLESQADQAFQALQSEALKANPFLEADNGQWLGAIVLVLSRNITSRMRDELIEQLATPESLRKALIQQVEQASLGMDAQAIRVLKASIKKMNKQRGEAENDSTT